MIGDLSNVIHRQEPHLPRSATRLLRSVALLWFVKARANGDPSSTVGCLTTATVNDFRWGETMSVIRVNPGSIQAYSRTASAQFEQMRSELEMLTRDVVAVRYFGPNAQAFKSQTGQLAMEFANALIADMRGIAEAIRSSTSSISAALGGDAIVIEFDGSPVAVPDVPAATDAVDVDTSALEALRPVITARFNALTEALRSHLSSLQGTDWEGQAKQGVVESVSQITASGTARASEAEANLTQAIDEQVRSVLAADR